MISREQALSAIQKQQRYEGRGVIGLGSPAGEGPFTDEQLHLMVSLSESPFIRRVPLPEVNPDNLADPPFTLDTYIAAKNQLRAEDAAAAQSS